MLFKLTSPVARGEEVEGDTMILAPGVVGETAGGLTLTTGQLVIGGVVGTLTETCHRHMRVGVAMGVETSMIDEGEPNQAN